jgi:hypothetical protein
VPPSSKLGNKTGSRGLPLLVTERKRQEAAVVAGRQLPGPQDSTVVWLGS